jgi:hypothetical protein
MKVLLSGNKGQSPVSMDSDSVTLKHTNLD